MHYSLYGALSKEGASSILGSNCLLTPPLELALVLLKIRSSSLSKSVIASTYPTCPISSIAICLNLIVVFLSNATFFKICPALEQLRKILTTFSLDVGSDSKEKYFDTIIKTLIRLLIPYKRKGVFEQFINALEDKEDISIEYIQNIVMRLKNIFPSEIGQMDISKYLHWIQQNESKWKEKIEELQLNKIFYGLAREPK